MSYNYRDRDRRNYQRQGQGNSRNYSQDQSYDRSRDNKSRNYNRDDRYNDRSDRPYNKNYSKNYNKNSYYKNRDYDYMDAIQVRDVTAKVEVQLPKAFFIGGNTQKNKNTEGKKFEVNVKALSTQPMKEETKLAELKNKITPIDKIWSSHIKQYLNNSEFVEIFRNGKSLAHYAIEYGKTIVKYDEKNDLKKADYENETSQSNIFSRAYFKLWEILSMEVFAGKENESLDIACVAEGPGGFIHSLIDFRKKQNGKVKDNFYSITLRIDKQHTRNAKDWSDFRGKKFFDYMRKELGYNIALSYGITDTGDLLLEENIDHFAEKDLDGKKCFLVTGDGGIECIGDKEFDYQEVFNVKLFLGEILTGLKVQAIGGTFILKVYDCSFELTRQLLALLTVFYEKVQMVKPITSRPGNSEKYMLCQGFLGMTSQEENDLKRLLKEWTVVEPTLSYFENKQFVQSILLFPEGSINYKETRENLLTANSFFLAEQESKLQEGLQLAADNDHDAKKIEEKLSKKRFKEQISYAYGWCQKYNIKSIDVKLDEDEKEDKKPQANQKEEEAVKPLGSEGKQGQLKESSEPKQKQTLNKEEA